MVGLCWTHFSDLKQRLLFGCPLNPNTGEEWVVNTLSRDGVHKVTDASWLAASHGIVYIFDPQLRWLFFCALSWLAFPKSRMSFSSVTVLTVLRLGMVHPSLCLALVHSTSFTTCNILPESHLASWRWLSDCASQGARDTSKPSTWGPLVIFSTFPGARPNLRRGQSPPKDGSLRVYACLHYLWQSPKTIGDHRNVNYRELLVAKHHVFADCKGWTLTGAVHSSSVSSDLTASTSMYQLMRQRSPYFDWNQQSQFYACNNYINLAFVLGWSWMCTCALVHLCTYLQVHNHEYTVKHGTLHDKF